jgi:hypothetical protein
MFRTHFAASAPTALFKLPRLETGADAIAALGLIAGGLASGKLLPHEAESLGNVVAAFVKTIAASNCVPSRNYCSTRNMNGYCPSALTWWIFLAVPKPTYSQS